jgi:hypothetical protein
MSGLQYRLRALRVQVACNQAMQSLRRAHKRAGKGEPNPPSLGGWSWRAMRSKHSICVWRVVVSLDGFSGVSEWQGEENRQP